MSPYSKDQFNVWFPALFCGLVIGLIAAAGWDFLRRRFWCCVSRFWPGVLGEVGLDNLSRVEVEERMRLVSDMLSEVHSEVTKLRVTPSLSMAKAIDPTAAESSNSSNSSMSSNNDFDLEGQEPVIHPFPASTGRPITFTATAYFADGTPTFVIRPVKRFFKRHGNGTVKRWKSSIVLQASLPIEACVVAEFEELARISILVENQCTFQLGNWAILYYKAGKVCLHKLKEGDVPVNVEARWQNEKTGIEMRGLYLNGAQVKVATEHTSTILRSVGPATKGHGDFDELTFNIEDLDVPREDAIIFAAKLIDGDGISLIVRSDATFIRPERAKSTVTEAFWSGLQWIFQSAKMMTKTEDRQPETALTSPDFFLDQEQCELIVEHWKGVLEIEILEKRKEVLHYLQELRESGESYARFSYLYFKRDRHSEGHYWQRVLQELNEVILQHEGCSQCGTHIRLRGGIRFLLGNYEDALHDLDRAHLVMQDDHWTSLYERALVKCMLARYSEALEDVCLVISINSNFSDIQVLKTCIQHILDQRTPFQLVQDGVSSRQSQPLHIEEIPDLLTGDERHSSGADCSRIVPNWWSSEGLATHANLAQPKDVAVAVGADAWPLNPSEPDGDLPQDYGHQRQDPFLLALAAGSGSVPGRTESLNCCASSRDEAQLWQEVVNDVDRQTTSSDLMDVVGVEEYGVGPGGSRNPCQVLENMGATRMGLVQGSTSSYFVLQKSILASNEPHALHRFDRVEDRGQEGLAGHVGLRASNMEMFQCQDENGGPRSDLGIAWDTRIVNSRGKWDPLRECVFKDTWLGIPCAKKVLKAGEWNSYNISTLATLKHPNIVNFLHIEIDRENRGSLVMELMSRDLKDLIQTKLDQGSQAPFPLPVAVDIMTQIAICMSHLHDHGIYHQDLKPGNVLVSRHNSPYRPDYLRLKLADFGLPKAGRSIGTFRASGSLEPALGTKIYRAPEVFSQDARVSEKRYPRKCDVWSYGVVFSDFLHGKVAVYNGEHAKNVQHRNVVKLFGCGFDYEKKEGHLVTELMEPFKAILPTRLNEALLSNARPKLPPGLPEELASIIRDCWVEDPRERPLFVDICSRLRSVQKRLNPAPHHELDPPVSTYAHGECSESAGSESVGSESADSSFVSEPHVRNDSEQAAEVDVSKLITDLSSGKTEVHRDAAYQIRCLTKMNSDKRRTIAEQGGIPFLINLLWSPDKMTQEHAVTALLNLSLLESNRALIMRAEAINGIIHVVKWGQSMEARENAAATIQCLSYENENKISIGNAGAIPALVELLQNGTLQGKKDAASALCNLTSYQEGNKRQAIRAGIALVLKNILHGYSTHELDDIFLSILANLSVLPDGLVEIGNTEPVTMLINFINCGSSKGQELATALLCRLCLADPCFIEAAYHCGATDPLEAVLRSETATLRCKCKAQRLLDRLSDGAQRRQEVVNVRREVLEYVNDRREVLNPISQLGQEMKRLRMTKMGLVGSPRASGSNSALQKSTLASKEPQEQPRFRQSVTGESPSWLTEREFPLHCLISKVSKLHNLHFNDSGNSTKFWHPYGPQIPRHKLYPWGVPAEPS